MSQTKYLMEDSQPTRELAVSRLQARIEDRRRELLGLEALLKVAEKAEPGSPLEEILWKLAVNV